MDVQRNGGQLSFCRRDGPDGLKQAAAMAFEGDQQIAVLIGQRLLDRKQW